VFALIGCVMHAGCAGWSRAGGAPVLVVERFDISDPESNSWSAGPSIDPRGTAGALRIAARSTCSVVNRKRDGKVLE
jgi:hypothetical protein